MFSCGLCFSTVCLRRNLQQFSLLKMKGRLSELLKTSSRSNSNSGNYLRGREETGLFKKTLQPPGPPQPLEARGPPEHRGCGSLPAQYDEERLLFPASPVTAHPHATGATELVLSSHTAQTCHITCETKNHNEILM